MSWSTNVDDLVERSAGDAEEFQSIGKIALTDFFDRLLTFVQVTSGARVGLSKIANRLHERAELQDQLLCRRGNLFRPLEQDRVSNLLGMLEQPSDFGKPLFSERFRPSRGFEEAILVQICSVSSSQGLQEVEIGGLAVFAPPRKCSTRRSRS
ncbi:hypothetical protein ACIRRA_33745 [Nocardia sp. NPDC101769]|uniref:hypothetical protein n=1 Tax=Nocardia sp. NPDC101769 TaxID=3364333 RepID=UPI0038169B40